MGKEKQFFQQALFIINKCVDDLKNRLNQIVQYLCSHGNSYILFQSDIEFCSLVQLFRYVSNIFIDLFSTQIKMHSEFYQQAAQGSPMLHDNLSKSSTSQNSMEQQCLIQSQEFDDSFKDIKRIKLKQNNPQSLFIQFDSSLNIAQLSLNIEYILKKSFQNVKSFNSFQVDNFTKDFQQSLICQEATSQPKQQPQIKERRQLIEQLSQIKKKTLRLKLPRFQSNILRLYQMSQKQLEQRILKIGNEDVKSLKKEISGLKFNYQKIVFNNKQICKHKNQSYYICFNQYRREKIHLCNQCIDEIKQTDDCHQRHQICCKRHKKPIKYKIVLAKQSNEQQQSTMCQQQERNKQTLQEYLCSTCIELQSVKQKRCSIFHVSECHFQIIFQICSQAKCITNKEFLLCPICMNNTHEGHSIINFTKESLLQTFKIEKQINIHTFEELYLSLRQNLQLRSIGKTINSYLQQLYPISILLESFAVHSNKQLQEWVQLVMKEGKAEDMLVLWWVQHIKNQNLQDEDKRHYLQAFKILSNQKLENLHGRIAKDIQFFKKQLTKIANITQQQVNQVIFNTYRQIINIQNKCQSIIQPLKLQQIKSFHYNKVQKIHICKQKQQINQEIENDLRTKRKIFFGNTIQQAFKLLDISEYDQEAIIKLFIDEQDEINLKRLKKLSKYERQISQLLQQLKCIKQQFRKKKQQCLPWIFIMKHQFPILKVIDISYEQANGLNLSTSISAFQLFKVIHYNKQLTEVTIKGVAITYFDQLMAVLRNSQCSKSTLQGFTDNLHQNKWVTQFHPSEFLKLAINAQIIFSMYEKLIVQKIDDLVYFTQYFKLLSNMSVKIHFGQWRVIQTQMKLVLRLLDCIQNMQYLSLSISKPYYYDGLEKKQAITFAQSLFGRLKLFTSITQLSFQGIIFCQSVEEQTFLILESYLRNIFNNNRIVSLQLHFCYRFPPIVQINTLERLNLQKVSFRCDQRSIQRVIQNNPQIKSIKCNHMSQLSNCRQQEWIITQEAFDNIQTLNIKKCDGFQIKDAFYTSTSSITSLTIEEITQTKFESIQKQAFHKLLNLNYLLLNGVNFDCHLFQVIPSLCLKQLHIIDNGIITNIDLYVGDCKWPYLSSVTIWDCPQVSSYVFLLCKFKGVTKIFIDERILGKDGINLQYLKMRGVQIETR